MDFAISDTIEAAKQRSLTKNAKESINLSYSN
jgi:hypothetical protein